MTSLISIIIDLWTGLIDWYSTPYAANIKIVNISISEFCVLYRCTRIPQVIKSSNIKKSINHILRKDKCILFHISLFFNEVSAYICTSIHISLSLVNPCVLNLRDGRTWICKALNTSKCIKVYMTLKNNWVEIISVLGKGSY